ncbi:MAG: hypothetical protein JNM56_04060 [Planctomycetia bacterium]|nr:hypothetical protein [Planctomycetia bacterium]
MRILSYVVRFDAGCAPNPFGGRLTLVTCKPGIRRTAVEGDLIVGTGSATFPGNDRLIFAAKVAATVPLEDYGSNPEYRDKIPSFDGEPWRRYGDNYYFMENGVWRQRKNKHHPLEALEKDVSGKNALICDEFWYFGRCAVQIPSHCRAIIKKGPGFKIIEDTELVHSLNSWLKQMKPGLRGKPCLGGDDLVFCATTDHVDFSSRAVTAGSSQRIGLPRRSTKCRRIC